MDTRHKGKNWSLPTTAAGNIESWEAVTIAVLMDIRDELQSMNRILHCSNFLDIPNVLRRISRHVAKPKQKKKQASI